MSGKVIQCFNEQECTYEKCPVFSPEMDTCKLELFKTTVKQVKPQRTAPTPKEAVQHAAEHVPGVRQISSLKEGETGNKQNPIIIKGTLVFDPVQKDVDTQRGPSTVTSFVIKDGSGEAKVSCWGDAGNRFMDFQKGDELFLEGLYKVKAPYDGKPQVDAGKYYKVAKLN